MKELQVLFLLGTFMLFRPMLLSLCWMARREMHGHILRCACPVALTYFQTPVMFDALQCFQSASRPNSQVPEFFFRLCRPFLGQFKCLVESERCQLATLEVLVDALGLELGQRSAKHVKVPLGNRLGDKEWCIDELDNLFLANRDPELEWWIRQQADGISG